MHAYRVKFHTGPPKRTKFANVTVTNDEITAVN